MLFYCLNSSEDPVKQNKISKSLVKFKWPLSALAWTDPSDLLSSLPRIVYLSPAQWLSVSWKSKLSLTFRIFHIFSVCTGHFFHFLHKASFFSSFNTYLKISINQEAFLGHWTVICSYGILQNFLTFYCNYVSTTWLLCIISSSRLRTVSIWSSVHPLVMSI